MVAIGDLNTLQLLIMKYIFDVEGDDLLHGLTKLHCIVIRDADTRELVASCADQPGYPSIEEGLLILADATALIGHNIKRYDLPAIKKLYGVTYENVEIYDTLTMARMLCPKVKDVDKMLLESGDPSPDDPGSHSLEAWGQRLGVLKGSYGKTANWKVWSKEMQEYCEGDTMTNSALWDYLLEVFEDA